MDELLPCYDSTRPAGRAAKYSKQLGVNVLTTRDDPRSGKEVFTALFALPADFRIVDLRAALTR